MGWIIKEKFNNELKQKAHMISSRLRLNGENRFSNKDYTQSLNYSGVFLLMDDCLGSLLSGTSERGQCGNRKLSICSMKVKKMVKVNA